MHDIYVPTALPIRYLCTQLQSKIVKGIESRCNGYALGISTTTWLLLLAIWSSWAWGDSMSSNMGPRQLSRVPGNLSPTTTSCKPTTLINVHCAFTDTRGLLTKTLAKRRLYQNRLSCNIFDCSKIECFNTT